MSLPTLAQVRSEPAFENAVWDLEPNQRGVLAAGKGRGGPYDISWEVHGQGPIKIILIGGIGVTKADFQNQTLFFGHLHSKTYSLLLLDNLGSGASSAPLFLFSPQTGYITPSLAADVLELADSLGWTSPRSLHVAGGSMGGMIAQEIGMLAPERLASLLPWATCARFERVDDGEGLWGYLGRILAMLVPKTREGDVRAGVVRSFPVGWLLAREDEEGFDLPDDSVPGCEVPLGGYGRFATNYARIAALEVRKREDGGSPSVGFWMQAMAAGGHCKTPEQLREIGDRVGRERIMVVHGLEDKGIVPELGRRLIAGLEPGRSIVVEGMGHGVFLQRPRWFNEVLREHVARGEELSGR